MSRVFIVNEPLTYSQDSGTYESKMNFRQAELFGSLVFLTDSGTPPHDERPAWIAQSITSMQDKLKDFGEDDFLLPVGHPALMVAASAIVASAYTGPIKVLIWDRRRSKYDIECLDFEQTQTLEQETL